LTIFLGIRKKFQEIEIQKGFQFKTIFTTFLFVSKYPSLQPNHQIFTIFCYLPKDKILSVEQNTKFIDFLLPPQSSSAFFSPSSKAQKQMKIPIREEAKENWKVE
jgi:hypothetical protein